MLLKLLCILLRQMWKKNIFQRYTTKAAVRSLTVQVAGSGRNGELGTGQF